MRLLFLLLTISCTSFPACRHYSRVERHFLRVPALEAAGISSIGRAKWLKEARKEPAWQDQAREQNYLFLSAATLPPGVRAPEGEVRFFPENKTGRTGMVALHWRDSPGPAGSGSLSLLKVQGGRYAPQSLGKCLNTKSIYDGYSLREEPGAIVCYQQIKSPKGPVWKKAAILRWQRGQWMPEIPP